MMNFVIPLLLLTVVSCSSNPVTNSDNFEVSKKLGGIEKWKKTVNFSSYQEALDYSLDRRLTIQRFHQLSSEPYFGTPEQKKCDNNIDITGTIDKINNGTHYYLKVLANENYALGDCLRENNTQDVYYEFFICANGEHIEVRHYQPYDSKPPVLNTEKCLPK